jgi:hypothetical protein
VTAGPTRLRRELTGRELLEIAADEEGLARR